MTAHRVPIRTTLSWISIALLAGLGLVSCTGSNVNRVVVYTSLDRDISEPVLNAIAQKTGLTILPQFDAELTKTTGLYLRLLAEREHPTADLFWNSEVARTIQLASEGVLAPYRSPEAAAYPESFRDPDGYWTGFAARARVIVYNTNLVSAEEAPKTLADLCDPKWKGRVGIAKPFFGTTATHAAALYIWEGESALLEHFRRLQSNDARFLPGNATVRDMVANGSLAVGLTDTDDVWGALADSRPVQMIPIDSDGDGTLLIPNTVALIQGGPNPEGAKKVIDALLSAETETMLAQARGKQIPLRTDTPPERAAQTAMKYRPIDFNQAAEVMPRVMALLDPLFQ